MRIESLTAIVFWGLFAILMLYDLVIVLRFGLKGTVTHHWWELAKSHPIVVSLFGIACGHLFKTIDPVFHMGISAVVILYFPYALIRYGYKDGMQHIWRNHALAFFCGFLLGLYFWGETDY